MANNQVDGLDDLIKTINELGQLPQRCVTPAARKGGQTLLRAVRAAAPVETGDLRRGIVLKPEKSRRRGKKVYQVVFDANMNDVFAKVSKSGKRAYYPSSMEYGYVTRNGGYIPGYRFMRDTSNSMENAVKDVMIDVLSKQIDKLR